MALDAADLEIITRTLIAPLVDELRIEIRAVATETRAVAAGMKVVAAETKAVAAETKAVAAETRAVAAETRTVAAETRNMAADLESLRAETRTMRTEMVAGIAGLTDRVEHLILTTGEHWRDHERRLLRLERRREGNGPGSDDEDESGDE